MHCNISDPNADEIGGLENEQESGTNSLTYFLTLPTVATRVSNRKRDPIVDFTKSIILTSNTYISALKKLKQQQQLAVEDKERKRVDREEMKKRKAEEREQRVVEKEAKALERE
jgi:hypothetical protein